MESALPAGWVPGRCLTSSRTLPKGTAGPQDLDVLLELAQGIAQASLCGLGQTAPNPVLTTLRYFRDEYEAHIQRKRCPAVVCKEIISSPCQHVCPIETQAPVYIALLAEGRFQEAFAAIVAGQPTPFGLCAGVPSPLRSRVARPGSGTARSPCGR